MQDLEKQLHVQIQEDQSEAPEGLKALVEQILSKTVEQYQVGRPRNDSEAAAICDRLARSNAIPRAYLGKPGDICAVMVAGQRFGFDVMQSMMAFCCINGAPRLWGDAAHAIFKVANDPRLDTLFERPPHVALEREEGLCRIKFQGSRECQRLDDGGCLGEQSGAGCCIVRRFSRADAERAGLWGRESRQGEPMPWKAYAGRMLQMRARSWAERDADPGCFRGYGVAEEVARLAEGRTRRYAEDLMQPMAKSKEKTPEEINRLLAGTPQTPPKAVSSPSPSPKPHEAVKSSAEGKGNVWQGGVVDVTSKSGETLDKKGKAKPWTCYFIVCGDGRKFATFSETDADIARSIVGKDAQLRVTYEVTPKGEKAIHVEPVLTVNGQEIPQE